MEPKVYKIKPHTRLKFSGISALPKTRTIYTGAQMDADGLYKTGLTPAEEEKYEAELGLAKGTLSRTNKNFWAFLELRLNNDKETRFAVASAMDMIKFSALTSRTNVAKNSLEVRNNPNIEFYVEDPEAVAKAVEIDANIEIEALDRFVELTAAEKKGILKVMEGTKKTPLRGINNLSETVIKATLFKEIKADPRTFLNIANDPDMSIRVMIQELLEDNKLTKKGNYYIFQGESIGANIDAVVEFFKDPKNQSYKITAVQETKESKKSK